MTKEFFDANVIMAVEIEYDCGGRHWTEMKGSEVQDFINNLGESEGLSDIDYCTKQENPEIKEILDQGYKMFDEARGTGKYKNIDEAIDEAITATEKPSKRIWTEEEIKNLIQTNDKVLYAAFKKLYACQTADEQYAGHTQEYNGIGFNGVDAPILSSMAEFLIKTGFLTPKQKVVVRKKLIKYNTQLTKLTNA